MANNDAEHLRILGVFHFVVAGVAFLFSLIPIIHLAFGIAMLSGMIEPENEDEFPKFVGWIFVAFSLTWIFLGLTFSACLAIAGRNLLRHRHHLFCLVVAGVACAFMPFGTVLGVFTILVLMRDSVKELFGVSSSRAA